MSTSSQPATFSDLYGDLQRRVHETTGVTATDNLAKALIDTALQDMHVGFYEKMPWAERSATLVTQASYNTGTVAITQGSTSLVGTSTLWATTNAFSVNNARANGKIVISGDSEIYTVSTVGSDTAITLASMYVGADQTAASYTYFEDEYDLAADFLRPVEQTFFDQATEIPLIGRREFRFRYPRNNVTGKPRVATIVDRAPIGNVTPIRRIAFWQPPDSAYMIPYSYITANLVVSSTGTAQRSFSADADEPIVPLQYRHVIVLHALKNYYRDIRDDTRARVVETEYSGLLLRIVGDQEIGRSTPQFRPRVSSYARSAHKPYNRGSAASRYTTGSRFDEIR